MKKSISLITGLLILASCANQAAYAKNQLNAPKKVFNAKEVKFSSSDYISSVQDFALDFYKINDSKHNQVFSPLSIATCFSMLYEGTDGDTKEEIRNALHYKGDDSHLNEIKNMLLKCAIDDKGEKSFLNIAQSIWFNGDGGKFKKEYVDKLTDYYYAEVFKNINFTDNKDKQLIADWVNDKTKNFLNAKPDDFQTDINTSLYLMNTVYLKSPWPIENLFDKSKNSSEDFTNLDGTKTAQTFMNGSVSNAYYLKKNEYRIASLPYKHNIRINILLPNETANYEEVLANEEAIKNMMSFGGSGDDLENAKIIWKLPKFKYTKPYDLKSIMMNLGLKTTFDKNGANLTRMTDDSNFYISGSYHKAGIELNNEGVEAAAFTYISGGTKSAPPQQPEIINFYVDHPFAYYLTTNEGLPLFMGVMNSL